MTWPDHTMPAADRYPALAQFVAGYLHQDFVAEHGTPAGAVRAFLREANDDERAAFRAEARQFLEAAAFRGWSDVTQAFADLGGAWLPSSRADLLTLIRAGLDA